MYSGSNDSFRSKRQPFLTIPITILKFVKLTLVISNAKPMRFQTRAIG